MRNWLTLLVVLASCMLVTGNAGAIPAFARKYQMSCSSCHAPIPRLNGYGEEFAAAGFRTGTQEPQDATIDTGDRTLQLMRELPLAVRMEAFASYKQGAVAEADIEMPWVLKIISGGPITDHLSYYFYYLIEQGEIVGIEDAWLQFNSIFKSPVDIQAGQFQVCDPLFKRELRLERFDYEIFKVGVGESSVDLTYDRGILGTIHMPAHLDLTVGVVNGNGIGTAEGEDKSFDNDTNKNLVGRLVHFRGPVRVGIFGYYGREDRDGRDNVTTYVGPDVVVALGPKFQLAGEFLYRKDDNPLFAPDAPGDKVITRGGFVELHYFPNGEDGKWTVSLLYNKVDSDDPSARRETGSVTLSYLLARNVRLMLDAGRDLDREATRVTAGVVTAF